MKSIVRSSTALAVAAVLALPLLAQVPAIAAPAGARPERSASAAAPVAPAAEVQVDQLGREGQGGIIMIGLRARCARAYTFQELSVEFSQGDRTDPSRPLSPVACDGAWHRVAFSSNEGFDPGHARLSARMTVVDDVTGDPAPQAVDTEAIWVRPAARVVIGRYAQLLRNGALVVHVSARCDRPWVEPSLSLSITQGVGENGAGASPSLRQGELTCNETWQGFDLRTRKQAGFRRGPAQVDAFLSVHDPSSFDPVAQAQASRTVLIR